MRSLNLDQLQTFVQVARLGSFTAAARHLHLTQPAVSFQVRELERRFGVTLLERVGRRARPSAAGRELLKHAARVNLAVDELHASLAAHKGELAGTVIIGAGATACIYLLPKYLGRLRARFPRLEMTVITDNTHDIISGIEDGTVDLALVTMPVRGRSLLVEPVIDDELVAIFPKSVVPEQEAIGAAALAEHPILQYEAGGNTRRIIDDWFLEAGVAAKPVMELGSIEAIKELVAAGFGCAVIPRMAVRREENYLARPLKPALYRELALITLRRAVMRPALQKVFEELQFVRDRPGARMPGCHDQ